MGWERREGSRRRYYFQSKWNRNGTATKHYVGAANDPATQVVAKADALSRANKQAARVAAAADRELYTSIDVKLKSFDRQVQLLLKAELVLKGYFFRNGGWKKMAPRNRTSAPPDAAESLPPTEQLAYLIERADRGDPDALDEIRLALADHPFIAESVGDLTAHVERSLIEAIAGRSVILAESLKCKIEKMREELAGEENVTAVERMLVDQVVLAWLELHYARIRQIDATEQRGETRFREERVEVASSRLATAMAELVKVRKLLGNDVVTEPDTTSTDES